MKWLFYYGLQVIIVSGILYGYYHFFLRNKKFHQYNRFYLLGSTLLALLVPLLNIPVYFTSRDNDPSRVLQILEVISSPGFEEPVGPATNPAETGTWLSGQQAGLFIYLFISGLVLLRIIFSLLKIRRISHRNPVEKLGSIHFVYTEEPGTPFSFFRWLFWNKKIDLHSEKGEQVFRHELYHIQANHSHDTLYTELLTVIGWINPFFHLIKRELKAIHEFLADQFAVSENKKWEYAELLLMQALQTRQPLVHPFFHNQIKRRIAMITNSSKTSFQYLRKLMVLPVAVITLALFAFSYKNKKNKPAPLEKSITVVIDAGHGNRTGARVNDIFEDAIVLSLAQKIRSLNLDPYINIILTREDDSNPSLADRTAVIEKNNADLLISLHLSTSNGATTISDRSENGIRFYIPSKRENLASRLLATVLENELKTVHKTANQIEQARVSIYVLEKPRVPAVLIECGNIADSGDHDFISAGENQDKIAKAILQAITRFSGENARTAPNSTVNMSDTTRPLIKEFPKKNPADPDPLIVVDGHIEKNLTTSNLEQKILPGSIESINVLKGESARARYGDKGKYGVIEIRLKKDAIATPGNMIFVKVENPPSFPGGAAQWEEYRRAQLDVNAPFQKGLPKGEYTVMVQFIVDTTGRISDLKALTRFGYGMEEQAINLAKQGPRWLPAIQNGKKVAAYHKQPVHFFQPPEKKQSETAGNSTLPKISTGELQTADVYTLLQIPPGTEITSFNSTFGMPNGKVLQLPNKGDQFDVFNRKLISGVREGELIIFDNILTLENGKEKRVPAKVYQVVN